jgi:hypothetical protein
MYRQRFWAFIVSETVYRIDIINAWGSPWGRQLYQHVSFYVPPSVSRLCPARRLEAVHLGHQTDNLESVRTAGPALQPLGPSAEGPYDADKDTSAHTG